MRGINIKWYRSVLTRIVAVFFVILVPIYAIGIVIYNTALEIVNTEITKSMEAQVSYYMDSLEKEILRINNLQQSLIGDVYLNRLAAIPNALNNYTRSQALLILQSRLDGISGSSQYISHFNVYISSIERVVDHIYVSTYDAGHYRRLCELASTGQLLVHSDERLLMLMPSPYLDALTKLPTFLFEIEIDRGAFQNALRQFNKYADSGSALFFTSSGSAQITGSKTTGGDIANITRYNVNADTESVMRNDIEQGHRGVHSPRGDFFLTEVSERMHLALSMYVPASAVLAPIIKYRKWFWVFTFCSLGMILLFSLSMYRSIYRPLNRLVVAFSKVENGDLQVQIEQDDGNEFGFLYKHFNDMVRNLAYQIEQVYTITILNQKAQLKQLQSQINPHFLYNSFFILNRRIKNNDFDAAMVFSHHLGSYFRFLSRSSKDEVMLMQEVDHARTYAEIQQMRFSSRLCVNFAELPHGYAELNVPRLILQPIIENAFEHGLQNKVTDGVLNILFMPEGNTLAVVVEDNGEEASTEALETLRASLSDDNSNIEITGLVNIHRRVRLFFGAGSGVEVSLSELGGLRVTLKMVFK